MEPEITGAWPCVCGEAEECESIGTDCCDEQPQCQTITHRDPDGSINVITCRQGMGCDAEEQATWNGSDSELTTCLCCAEAQECVWSEAFKAYVHRDGSEATRWHVHYSEAHRDCDGLFERSWIDWGDDDADVRNEKYDVWTNAVQHLAYPFGYGTLTIVPREDDAVEPISATWDERTDEGYRSRRAALCHLACSLSQRSQRDHSAEAAGY